MHTLIDNGRTSHASSRQAGAVLIIALVVLVAMTLSALSLIRAVNVTNLIAGNLAFRESALLSAERATEEALNDWLMPNATGSALYTNNAGKGYRALRADPAADSDWGRFWDDTLQAQSISAGEDAAGNTVRYVIHRLCETEGPPYVFDEESKCSQPPLTSDADSKIGGKSSLGTGAQVYYRITSQVKGPRNSVVYTQTIVAL